MKWLCDKFRDIIIEIKVEFFVSDFEFGLEIVNFFFRLDSIIVVKVGYIFEVFGEVESKVYGSLNIYVDDMVYFFVSFDDSFSIYVFFFLRFWSRFWWWGWFV